MQPAQQLIRIQQRYPEKQKFLPQPGEPSARQLLFTLQQIVRLRLAGHMQQIRPAQHNHKTHYGLLIVTVAGKSLRQNPQHIIKRMLTVEQLPDNIFRRPQAIITQRHRVLEHIAGFPIIHLFGNFDILARPRQRVVIRLALPRRDNLLIECIRHRTKTTRPGKTESLSATTHTPAAALPWRSSPGRCCPIKGSARCAPIPHCAHPPALQTRCLYP